MNGKVKNVPGSTKLLMQVLMDAEGKQGLDQTMLDQVYQQPAPGDVDVEHSGEASHEQKIHFGAPPAEGSSTLPPAYYGVAGVDTHGYPIDQKNAAGTAAHTHPSNLNDAQGHVQQHFPPPPVQYDASHASGSNEYYPPPPSGPPPQQAGSENHPGYYAPPPYPDRHS